MARKELKKLTAPCQKCKTNVRLYENDSRSGKGFYRVECPSCNWWADFMTDSPLIKQKK